MINIIDHAKERMKQRGITAQEVFLTVRKGTKTPASMNRIKFSFEFHLKYSSKKKYYSKKTVIVIAEQIKNNIDVITVYSKFY